jgi:hypothetical protein
MRFDRLLKKKGPYWIISGDSTSDGGIAIINAITGEFYSKQ